MMLSEQLAIIRKHQKAPPIQVVPLAEELGVAVYRQEDWPLDISGMIYKDSKLGGKSGYVIVVNASHHEHRRRFTIAHELAHFILHKDMIGDGIQDDGLYRSGLSSQIEVQANKLAADILMPWHLINQAIAQGYSTVPKLAELFNVSKSAMSIRLGVPYETAA